jgi:hypothetical protein
VKSPAPSPASLPWLASALLCLCACTQPPNGPATLLITVSDLPTEALSSTGPLTSFVEAAQQLAVSGPGVDSAGFYPSLAVGTCFTREPLEVPSGAPGNVVLPGILNTLAELEANAGIETASFVTDHAFDEEFGFQQGFFQAHDMAWIELSASSGWLDTAIASAEVYLAQKLPRPMEDAPFVWLHLDLSLIEDPAGRSAQVADCLERLGRSLAAREDHRLILWALPRNPAHASAVLVRGAAVPDLGSGPLTPLELGQRLPTWLGQVISGTIVRPAGATQSAGKQ